MSRGLSLGGNNVRKYFAGIRAKLIIVFILIGPLPVLVSGLFTVWQSEQGLITVEQNRLLTTGADIRAGIEEWVDSQVELLAELAALPSAIELDRGLFLPILELDETRRAAFDHIYLVLPSGSAQLGVDFSRGDTRLIQGAQARAFQVQDEQWFQDALAGGIGISTPILKLPYRSIVEKFVIHIGTPIRSGSEIVGVMSGTVWLDPVFDRVDQLLLGQSSEVYLIDEAGLPLMEVPSVAATDGPLATVAAQAIGRGESGVDVYDNASGVRVMGSYTHFPLFNWGLVLEIEEDRALASANDLGAYLRNALIWFGIATVAIVIFVGVIASGTITRPVYAFAAATRRVAEGDLTVPDLPVERTDELGAIARDFTQMVHDLRQAMGDVMQTNVRLNESRKELEASADQSYTAADEITMTITQVADGTNAQTASIHQTADSVETWRRSVAQIASGAQEQARRVEQTNELVEGMARGLHDVAHAAKQVAASAERDVKAAHVGGDAVRATVDGMEQIRTSVSEAAERVQQLGEHSQKIGEIVRIIEEIAEHTNLLALNAAIEAARAGEHGRGFAVVAQEVRNLAENSAQSTQQITALIASMHEGMKTAIAATAAGLEQVKKGSRLTVSAGEALQQIIAGIDESNQMAHDIAVTAAEISEESGKVVENVNEVAGITREHTGLTEQMSSAADQVVQAVADISTVSEQTAAGAQEVAASAEQGAAAAREVREAADKLGQYAAALDELIGRFKL